MKREIGKSLTCAIFIAKDWTKSTQWKCWRYFVLPSIHFLCWTFCRIYQIANRFNNFSTFTPWHIHICMKIACCRSHYRLFRLESFQTQLSINASHQEIKNISSTMNNTINRSNAVLGMKKVVCILCKKFQSSIKEFLWIEPDFRHRRKQKPVSDSIF